MTNVVILGGGWSGVLLSIKLKQIYPNSKVIVLEKEKEVGGLLRSEVVQNHIIDVGGSHIIFSRDEKILNEILSLISKNYVSNIRKSFVLIDSKFVPYPLENNLYFFSLEERAEALISFLEAFFSFYKGEKPKNLKEWIYGIFGDWIAKKYLEPYNLKVWKRPLEEIDIDWISPGRLPIPDWKDLIRSAIGIQTIGYKEQSIFYYPLRGGIQTLFNALYQKALKFGVKFITNYKIEKIEKKKDYFLINKEYIANKLYSTIPIHNLLKYIENTPENLLKLSSKLDYNKVAVIGIGLKISAPDQHWIYVPDNKIVFHRYAWISNYSPHNSPYGESTLIAEITIPPSHNVDVDKLTLETIDGFLNLEIFKERDILFCKSWIHEYGYPIHTLNRKNILKEIFNWLKDNGIISFGRWGSWEYWNIDRVYSEINKIAGGGI